MIEVEERIEGLFIDLSFRSLYKLVMGKAYIAADSASKIDKINYD